MVWSSPAPRFSSSRFNCSRLVRTSFSFSAEIFVRSLRRSRRCCLVVIDDFIPIGVHHGIDDRRRVFPIGFGGAHLHDAGDSSTEIDVDLARSASRWHCAWHLGRDAGPILQFRIAEGRHDDETVLDQALLVIAKNLEFILRPAAPDRLSVCREWWASAGSNFKRPRPCTAA